MTIVAVTGPLVFPCVVGGVSQASGRGNGSTSKQGDENMWFLPQIVTRFHDLNGGIVVFRWSLSTIVDMCGFCGDDGGIEIGRGKGKFNWGNDRKTLTWLKEEKKVIKE